MKTVTRESSKSGNRYRKNVIEVIAYTYCILFIYAATSKLFDYETFSHQIAKSPILSDYSSIIPWLIPSLEIIIVIMLITPKTILAGFYAALTIMVLFTTYIIVILFFSESIPCSCGGVLQKMGWNEHLIFNAFFILLAFTGIILLDKNQKT